MPDPITPPADNPEAKDKSQDNLPEKFKGKSADEIAKSYLELEKKLSEVGQTAAESKKHLDDLRALESFIDNDPESLQFLKTRIEHGKNSGTKTVQDKDDPRFDRLEQDVTDARLASQGQIFEKFENRYGLNEEGVDSKIKTQIGDMIKQMVSPKSSKTPVEIIASLPLDTLPMYLENAYKLVSAEDQKEQVRRKTLAQARQNADATFSTGSSTSLRSNSTTLTAEEKKVARGLGISEEKYLKQKKEINEEYQ